MATIREELQAKLVEIDAKWNAERAPIQEALNSAESWLGREYDTFKAELEAIIAKVRGTPPAA